MVIVHTYILMGNMMINQWTGCFSSPTDFLGRSKFRSSTWDHGAKWFFYMCCLLPFLLQPAIRDPPGTTFLEPCSIPMTLLQLGHLVRKAVSDLMWYQWYLNYRLHVELRPKTCKTQLIFSFKVVQSGFQCHFTTELPRRDSEVRCLAVRLGSQRSHFIWIQDVSTTPSKLPSFVHGLVWKCAIPWTLSFYSWQHNGHKPSNWGGAKKNHTQPHFEICTSMYNKFWVGPTETALYNSTMISAASRLRKMSPRCRRVVPRWRPFRKVGGWAQLRVPHGAIIFKRPCDLGWHIQINTT